MTTSIRKNPVRPVAEAAAPRRRLSPAERERQILDGAVRFFSEHGLDGQLRDLARELDITHTLLYHYFPTKQALIERVYADLFAARWESEWEVLLDDKSLDVETKLTRFYTQYAKRILERDWVRVFVFSGLSDRYITDRYFALLGEKLFPRLVRESRRYLGLPHRGPPTPREMELLMGLHGSIFYMGMRRWVYGLEMATPKTDPFDAVFVHDRVLGYLQTLPEVFGQGGKPRARSRSPVLALA
ncbi:MAG: TetR/AcrR family transcriptional regulator [Burkholderiales bacterium]|nr:TetR/AcrR family transcriptional regulator [Burkholderiales bacterium]